MGSVRKRVGRIVESVGISESFRFFFEVRCLLEVRLAGRVVEEAGSPRRIRVGRTIGFGAKTSLKL